MNPTPQTQAKNTWETLKIFSAFSWRYPVMLLSVLILLPITVVCGSILLPRIYAAAIDKVKDLVGSGQPFGPIFLPLVWQSVVLITISWAIWRIIGYTLSTFEFRVKRDLEQHIFRQLSEKSIDFHVNSFSGSLVSQTNRMTSAYDRLFDSVYFELFQLTVKIVGALVVLAPKSGEACLLIVAWLGMFIATVLIMQAKKMPLAKNAAAADSKVTAALADGLSNIFTVITFGSKKTEQKHFNETSQNRYKVALKDWYVSEILFAFQSFMMFVVEGAMIWLTVSLALQGKLSLGDIILVQFYLLNIMGSMWNFGRVVRFIERALADASEMTTILTTSNAIVDAKKAPAIKIKAGNIKFENVSFNYGDSGLFNNLNLNIKSGEKVGLVGLSGGGKTTITTLLLRLMDVSSGVISIDGQDISKVQQDSLRQSIAYVPQEPALFHRSLAANIAYGNPSATKKDILRAANQAHATEFIDRLPKGMETMVGERGVKLSGGQRQRVAIARAILKDSPILLLDEATSALDSESEALIQDALWGLIQQRTSIVIAHRLSTIRKMDRIIVLDHGQITEQGTHQELLKNNGTYAKLWQHQTGGFIK